MRAQLDYFDQNAAFESLLPRTGELSRRVALEDWGADWLVLTLDEPLEYEGTVYPTLLVRSRWEGHPIGAEPTSVFVLLVSDPAKLDSERLTADDFQLAAWGMIQTLDTA